MSERHLITSTAKRLAKQAKEEGLPMPPFRPITGHLPMKRLTVKIKPAKIKKKWGRKRKPGRPRMWNEPMDAVLVWMTRREKARWRRAAYDIGLSLSALIRLAMRYLTASRKMQKIIQLGPREIEARRKISVKNTGRRVALVLGDEEIDLVEEHVRYGKDRIPYDRDTGERLDQGEDRKSADASRSVPSAPRPGGGGAPDVTRRTGALSPAPSPPSSKGKGRLMIRPK